MNNIPVFALQHIILIVISYFLVFLVNRKTRSDSILLLVAVLTFHHVIAYLYAFHLSLPVNEVDPGKFLLKADECINFNYCGYLGYHLYVNYLAKMLELGGSLYFIFLINIIFFVISIYYFIGIVSFFEQQGNRKKYLILYSMWPSVIYFTTLHYREPFELYFLIAGIYFGLTGSKSDSFLRMLTSMLLLLLMGAFHIKGLILLSPIIFLILISYRLPLTILSIGKKIVLLLAMCVGVYFALSFYVSDLKSVSSNIIESPIEKIVTRNVENTSDRGDRLIENKSYSYEGEEIYKNNDVNIIDAFMKKVTKYRKDLYRDGVPGSAFNSSISDKNIVIFIGTYFLVYLEYLFSPFIFQVTSFYGVFAYAESVLRLILFTSAIVMLKRNPKTYPLFFIYLVITAMWAIGVVSYGASIRHHIQTNWILVILGVPVISEYIDKRLHLKKRQNGQCL